MWTGGARRGASLGDHNDHSQLAQPSQLSQSPPASSGASPIRVSFGSPGVAVSAYSAAASAASATSPTSTALRKRKRLVVSCQQCHRRKQKCDRNQPCKACVSRGTAGSCRYETVAMSRERHNMRVSEAVAPGSPYPRPAKVAKTTATMTTETPTMDYGYAFTANAQRHATHAGGFQQDGTPWYPPQPQPQPMLPNTEPSQHTPPDFDPHKLASTCRIPMDHVLPLGAQSQTLADRYAAQVRMLPPRVSVDRLVGMYFAKMNWQHGVLDEGVFLEQMADWYDSGGALDDGLPTTQTLSPFALAAEQRVFPALLFVVLATALLGLDADAEDDRTFFESIKNPSNVAFKDLALDYGDASMRILALLGKQNRTMETVQAGLVWTAFLQDASLITESWHALGSTIRDAQEIGLHSSSMDPRPHAPTAEAVHLNQWEVQRRRQLWMALTAWDLTMAAMLGRQPSVDLDSEPTLPVDCPLPKTYAERLQMPVQPRGETAAPTLVTRALGSYAVAAPLREVLKMLRQGSRRPDGPRIAALHAQLLAVEANTPAPFRAADPDTRFDDEPGCHWLPAVRGELAMACAFNRIALHRTYIFRRAKSRTEALKACFRTLSLQRAYFALPKAKRGCASAILYGSFDSLVLVAVIYILFPREHPELLPDAVQHFRWSAERFEALLDTFCLARPALDVLHALHLRLRKTLGIDFMGTDNAGLGGMMGPAAAAVGSAPVDALTLCNIDPSLKEEGPGDGGAAGAGADANGTAAATAVAAARSSRSESMEDGAQQQQPLQQQVQVEEAEEAEEAEEGEEPHPALFPADFDWTAVPPIYPTGDLAYNVLQGVSDGSASWSTGAADCLQPGTAAHSAALAAPEAFRVDGAGGAVPWLFAGDFGSNSLWGMLNTYAYAPFEEDRPSAWPV